MAPTKIDYYKRQFIIGEDLALPDFWKSLAIGGGLSIYAHPLLGLSFYKNKNRTIILLGYITDPDSPKKDDLSIIKNLLDDSTDLKSLTQNTMSLGGRWAIVYEDGSGSFIFTDPSGLRSVYYSRKYKILGSNPSIINNFKAHKRRDDPDFRSYINSKFYRINEYEWYTERSFYAGIYHVLPNSYLDIRKNKVHSFWLTKKRLGYKENIKRAGEILIGQMRAINYRQGIKIQSLTAGFDSRVIFGAGLRAGVDFDFFLSTMNILDYNSPDIKIARQILNDFGKDLHIIDGFTELSNDFLKIYKKNLQSSEILPKTLTIQYFFKKNKDYIHISGNNSAVFKNYYKSIIPKDIEEFKKTIGLPRKCHIFDDSLKDWLEKKSEMAREEKIDLMKLFYWEQKMPKWGCLYQQQADIAMEEFAPFNNRELYLNLIEATSLSGGHEKVFIDLIGFFDPKLLSYPINPKGVRGKILEKVKDKISRRNWEYIKVLVKK